MCATVHMLKSEDNSLESVPSNHVDFNDETQGVRLSSKHIYSLRHFAGSIIFIQ